jgi:hypothetical protein
MSRPDPVMIDFRRSFLRFSTDHSGHTPRLDVDAACTLISRDGTRRQYFLTCECIGEAMYVQTGLIHDPVSEFNLIAEPGQQIMQLKRHAGGERDVRSPHRVGDRMPTRDGRGARVKLLEVTVAPARSVRPIAGYEQFHAALHGDVCIQARTTYQDADGTQVLMEYPCRTINTHNTEPKWQVDAGPVLMTVGDSDESPLEITRLDMAFIVFNRMDYAEAVIRRGGPTLASANQYGIRRAIACQHELFTVE